MNNDHIYQIYRSNNILDEKVLSVIRKVKREDYVPEEYKKFSYCDISIPLDSGRVMLTPSCEAKILQNMEFHKKDNVLLVGTGSGYLVECISDLVFSITAYECDASLHEFGVRNLDLHSNNRDKLHLYNDNILNVTDKIQEYNKVVFTCSVKTYDFFLDYLSENSKVFLFLWQDRSPYSQGMIVNKLRNGYTVKKNIVTSQTNLIKDN